ncbi:MAG TPA: SRPBCC family protein [Urbifossiella sp.]|jgi:ligand-binding SRPBCC domain-containing protein|nr:SRPBCC family protein [Urbifossiella sp.]
MAAIRIVTTIDAPAGVCFDLARDIDFHTRSMEGTGERAVAGRTTGLIGLGESVTWEARHLGVRQRLTAEVTAFDRPVYFRDVMTAGAFRSFAHDHRFEERDGRTVMTDDVTFRAPFGPLGWLVDRLVLAGYLRRMLEGRGQALKREAEAVARRSARPDTGE